MIFSITPVLLVLLAVFQPAFTLGAADALAARDVSGSSLYNQIHYKALEQNPGHEDTAPIQIAAPANVAKRGDEPGSSLYGLKYFILFNRTVSNLYNSVTKRSAHIAKRDAAADAQNESLYDGCCFKIWWKGTPDSTKVPELPASFSKRSASFRLFA